MSRLAIAVAAVASFVLGVIAMVEVLDRLFGGNGWPRVEVDELAESWGDL